MSIGTNIRISFNGKEYKRVLNMSLDERIGEHTYFRASIRGKFIESSSEQMFMMERSREYLGRSFFIEITSDRFPEIIFKGIVSKVHIEKGTATDGFADIIHIDGISASVVLQNHKHDRSFLDKTLQQIINESLQPYTSPHFKATIAPEYQQAIPYSVQQDMTTFEYLKHLAARHGEYLMYCKDTLYFGRPDLGDEVTLYNGRDLKKFYYSMGTTSLKYNYYAYDHNSETQKLRYSEQTGTGAKGDTYFASKQSHEMYLNQQNFQVLSQPESRSTQRDIDRATLLQKKMLEQNLIIVEAESINTGVTLGKIIKILDQDGEYRGKFRVVEVQHRFERLGQYQNYFKAVPVEIDIYPLTDVNAMVKSGSEVGVVVDTNDPDKMSRIKVQFPWQKEYRQTTPWIRVATPYAGSDRGFHMIPEVGDVVQIGFDKDNAERPFVMAAFYTGKNKHKQWQSKNNDFKGITTRSGHTIELNDTKGAETIRIHDKDGAMISFDTKDKSLTIKAVENLNLAAKNINIVADEAFKLHSKGTIEIASDQKSEILSRAKISLQAADNTEIASSSDIILEAKGDAKVKGINATLEGASNTEIKGSTSKISGIQTTIQGGSGKTDYM